jgi:multidrug resistance efflux pump
MKKPIVTFGRLVLTLLFVCLAAFIVWRMVMYYMYAPWTRDGHVRADIIQIAPDVSGLIEHVNVHDNQPIKAGDVLFTIDQDRFRLALRQAQASMAERKERWPRPNESCGAIAALATWLPANSSKRASRGSCVPRPRCPKPKWQWMPRS